MRRRRLLALLAAAGLAGSALACSSSDGRNLPPPHVLQTTTTPSAPIVQPSAGSVDVFTLSSASFSPGAEIPAKFTCGGDSVSPALAWTGTPLDASSLAIVVRDLSAGGFVHWIVTGIDPFVQGMGEGGLPEAAIEGMNSTGSVGWTGPCPPAGSGTHTYEFAVLALVDLLNLPLDTPAEEAATAIETAAVERAILTGTVASA
jgi:Raf kinase inhibitor-like YbhB/YbcL family protein